MKINKKKIFKLMIVLAVATILHSIYILFFSYIMSKQFTWLLFILLAILAVFWQEMVLGVIRKLNERWIYD